MKKFIIYSLVVLLFNCKQNNSKETAIVNNEKNNLESIAADDAIVSYPLEYFIVKPDSISVDFKSDTINVDESTWLDGVNYITGTSKNNEKGFFLTVLNKSNEVVYTSDYQEDSWRFDLTFYRPKNHGDIIILGEIGDEESWGTHIFKTHEENTKKLDFLDIVALNEYGETQSCVDYLILKEMKENIIEFSFNKSIKIYDNLSEKEFSSTAIKYRCENNNIKKIDL